MEAKKHLGNDIVEVKLEDIPEGKIRNRSSKRCKYADEVVTEFLAGSAMAVEVVKDSGGLVPSQNRHVSERLASDLRGSIKHLLAKCYVTTRQGRIFLVKGERR